MLVGRGAKYVLGKVFMSMAMSPNDGAWADVFVTSTDRNFLRSAPQPSKQ